jgi:hypothetical protein
MRKSACILLASLFSIYLSAQIKKAPEVKDGDGPWPQLIIRGVTLINSTGAPPVGPVDIVVEKNRIVQIANVGNPGLPINNDGRPKLKEGGKELNCEGMFLLPGLLICMVILAVQHKAHRPNMFLNFGWRMASLQFVIQAAAMDLIGYLMKKN